MPTVSVIMAAYRTAPYLDAAIASVCAQTYRDFELLVVDDGSPDDCRAIAERWAERDARIRVWHQANAGISSARNHALRLAAGDLIALLDSDDAWAPEFLAAQVAILEARPEVDIVTGNAWFLGSRLDGTPARPTPDPRPVPDLSSILADEDAVFIMSVFRRRVYDTIGGFDESLGTNEDFDFWLRAALAGFRFCRNDQPLGRYRRRDDSLSANAVRMLRGVLKVYEKLRPMLQGRPGDLAVLERQVARFQSELASAEARAALDAGDPRAIRQSLEALHARHGGARLYAARVLARLTPGLLVRAYHWRRGRMEANA